MLRCFDLFLGINLYSESTYIVGIFKFSVGVLSVSVCFFLAAARGLDLLATGLGFSVLWMKFSAFLFISGLSKMLILDFLLLVLSDGFFVLLLLFLFWFLFFFWFFFSVVVVVLLSVLLLVLLMLLLLLVNSVEFELLSLLSLSLLLLLLSSSLLFFVLLIGGGLFGPFAVCAMVKKCSNQKI